MKTYKITVKDVRPSIGIFLLVNDNLYVDAEPIDTNIKKSLYDYGKLHAALFRQICLITKDKELASHYSDANDYYRNFERGRVVYDAGKDEWVVTATLSFLQNSTKVNELKRMLGLSGFNNISLEASDLYDTK